MTKIEAYYCKPTYVLYQYIRKVQTMWCVEVYAQKEDAYVYVVDGIELLIQVNGWLPTVTLYRGSLDTHEYSEYSGFDKAFEKVWLFARYRKL